MLCNRIDFHVQGSILMIADSVKKWNWQLFRQEANLKKEGKVSIRKPERFQGGYTLYFVGYLGERNKNTLRSF